VRLPDIRTLQLFAVGLLSQLPGAHPPKVEGAVGVAVKVTVVFATKFALHALVQASPAGELPTVPLPPPAKSTVSVGCDELP